MSYVLASAESLCQIYATMACGLLVLDPQGVVLDANLAAQEILGTPEAALLGRTVAQAFPPIDTEDGGAPAREHPLQGALTRPLRNLSLGICRPDGERRWLHADAIPVAADTGGPATIVVTFLDTTARTLAEERLRLLESVVVQANDAVLITEAGPVDQPGPRIVYANGAFTRTTGYSLEEVLGRNPRMLQGPDSDRATLDTVRAALELWQPVVAEMLNYRKDGSTFWVEFSIVPVADANGRATHWVSVQRDVTAGRQQEALRHQASHDALTDLPNRTLLQDRLVEALRVCERDAAPLALLLLDLDHFKEVNDALGHHAGDGLLRQVGPRIQRALCGSDTIARLGGDEFAVLLPGVGAAGAGAVAEAILAALEPPFEVAGHMVEVRASVGAALAPAHGTAAEELLQHADVAMYVAKRGQRSFALYDPSQDTHSPERFTLIQELRQAIGDGRLALHFQPQVLLGSGQICGMEALVRWPHATRGLIPPDGFVPLAEQTGLIAPLTRWVLETALRRCTAWQRAGHPFGVAVNLAMSSLHDAHLPNAVAALVEQVGVAPSSLTLEITESGLMADPARAMAVLTRLDALGVQIAIDDFGTGYSSLSYLKDMPVDELKIDKSFVLGMGAGSGDKDLAIVRSVIALGRALDLRVVAEGVETAMALELVRDAGCNVVQGYHLSRPLPPPHLEQWLRARG